MRVLVSASERFAITPDGSLWTANAALGYPLWAEYLDVYAEVHLLARARQVPAPPQGWIQATGDRVIAAPVPYFVGPWQFARHYWRVRHAVRAAVAEAEAFQLRLSCTVGSVAYECLKPGQPFGVEVVTDPYDMFAPGSVQHPLRAYFRWQATRELRQQCAAAIAALYVTQQALQTRYPCPGYSVGVSDVKIDRTMRVAAPRTFAKASCSLHLVYVGTLNQLYKAPHILIEAVARVVQAGLNVKLTLVGGGQYQPQLEAQAQALGIGDRTLFCGQLPSREAVQQQMDQADVFVLPSFQEGLPKAMVEAMARSLPCIGSNVGGIPELLAPEDLVTPGDVEVLAAKLREVITDPERLTRMSARNWKMAQMFDAATLHQKRCEFYRYVRSQTEQWYRQQA